MMGLSISTIQTRSVHQVSTLTPEASASAESYVRRIYEEVKHRDPQEREFHQAVKEILDSLVPVLARHPHYMEHAILERLVEPERSISFRVPGAMTPVRSASTAATGSSSTVLSDHIKAAFVSIHPSIRELSNFWASSRYSKML